MTGPTGKVLLLPEDPNAVVIMVATGTGIAPFRTFWRRMFMENVPNYKFTGLAWLFMGVANSDAKLYDDEIQSCVRPTRTSSGWITPCPGSRPTSAAERCTFRTRSRSTPTRSLI